MHRDRRKALAFIMNEVRETGNITEGAQAIRLKFEYLISTNAFLAAVRDGQRQYKGKEFKLIDGGFMSNWLESHKEIKQKKSLWKKITDFIYSLF